MLEIGDLVSASSSGVVLGPLSPGSIPAKTSGMWLHQELPKLVALS